MNTVQKFITGSIVGTMILSAGVGATFAQADDTATEADSSACTFERGDRENSIRDALEELGLTREDVRDYDGTVEELLAENGIEIDVEALREEHEAERDANLLDCIAELEADGTLTAEQAETLSAAVEDGTFRDVVSSEEFEGVFPERNEDGRGEGRRGRGGRHHGNGDGGWEFTGDDAPPANDAGDE